MRRDALAAGPAPAGEAGVGPVDLAHLAEQTFGDAELEREVLALFERTAGIYLLRLKGALRLRERREAAHLISGSARGIGAWRVAELARCLEEAATPPPAEVDRLEAAIAEVLGFIRGIRGLAA
jgi:HPt (histidine-containing phosphotransfer) domain-containing protein